MRSGGWMRRKPWEDEKLLLFYFLQCLSIILTVHSILPHPSKSTRWPSACSQLSLALPSSHSKRSLVLFNIFVALSYFLSDDQISQFIFLTLGLGMICQITFPAFRSALNPTRYPRDIPYIGMILCTLITMHDLKYHYFPTPGKLVKFERRKSSAYLLGGRAVGIGMLHVVIGDVRP